MIVAVGSVGLVPEHQQERQQRRVRKHSDLAALTVRAEPAASVVRSGATDEPSHEQMR